MALEPSRLSKCAGCPSAACCDSSSTSPWDRTIQQKPLFSVHEVMIECILHCGLRYAEMLAEHGSSWKYCVAGLGCC